MAVQAQEMCRHAAFRMARIDKLCLFPGWKKEEAPEGRCVSLGASNRDAREYVLPNELWGGIDGFIRMEMVNMANGIFFLSENIFKKEVDGHEERARTGSYELYSASPIRL